MRILLNHYFFTNILDQTFLIIELKRFLLSKMIYSILIHFLMHIFIEIQDKMISLIFLIFYLNLLII